MRVNRKGWVGVVGALSATITLALPAAAGAAAEPAVAGAPTTASDPPFSSLTAQLKPIPVAYDPTSANGCVSGKVSCVKQTIAKMQKRYTPLSTACAHNGVFALSYLLTTQEYLRSATTPGFYSDPAFVNHEDFVFASLYFSAYDNWKAGRRANVPVAWRLALDAGKQRTVSGVGDLLLGINAHVNRDLPFTLAAIGLTKPDGSSRKPDHDKVNVMLNAVTNAVVEQAAKHYDAGINAIQTPYGVGYAGLFQLIEAWRESAWRAAEQLTLAPTADARSKVAAAIENDAATQARTIIATNGFAPPVTSTAARDAYCSAYVAGGGS